MSDSATSMTNTDRELIQSIINLGNDDFKLSAIPPDDAETAQVGFVFDPRVNYYLGENENNYVEKKTIQRVELVCSLYTRDKVLRI